eukprot:255421-Rhodomonas_salina.1
MRSTGAPSSPGTSLPRNQTQPRMLALSTLILVLCAINWQVAGRVYCEINLSETPTRTACNLRQTSLFNSCNSQCSAAVRP